MLAPPRPLTRGPVLRRRTLARGSLVGVGLLALTASGVPVALADDEAVDPAAPGPEADLDGVVQEQDVLDPDVPVVDDARPASSIEGFFGSGKSVGIQVDYDEATAPSDLDLSGAVFTLTGADGDHACTTDVTGFCWIPEGSVPPGDYTVTQTGHAVGLAAATGAGSIHLCSWMEGLMRVCGNDTFGPVVNDSVFRSPVVTSVEDSVTGAPIEGAEYTLTGPAYNALVPDGGDLLETQRAVEADSPPDETVADEGPALQEVSAVSAADGSLTFDGWFLPGTEYVLAPLGTVNGYQADTETTDIEITPSAGTLPASLAPRLLTPIAIAIPEPVVPTDPTPAVTPGPVPAPPVTPAGAETPAAGRPGRVVTPAPAAPAEPATTGATPTPTPSASASTVVRFGAGEPTDGPLAGGTASPELATVSSNLPDKGLVIALGGLFLIAILVGIGLVRRHARRRV